MINQLLPQAIFIRKKPPQVCSYEGSDYQEVFWDTGERRYEDAVEEVALKRLMPKQGKLLLELGAGAGRNTPPRYAGWERIVLLDYSRTQLLQARERLGDSSRYVYVTADIYKLPFVSGLFDGATMIRTLHHLSDANSALANVRRVLGEDAVFVLEFANKRNLKAIARYLLGKQKWNPFTKEQVEFVALNYNFHPKTVRKLLKENQFALKKTAHRIPFSHQRVETTGQTRGFGCVRFSVPAYGGASFSLARACSSSLLLSDLAKT